MARCSVFTVSKYAYKGKKKLCPNAAMMFLCIPYSNVESGMPLPDSTPVQISSGQATVVAFDRMCAMHGSIVQTTKVKAKEALVAMELGRDVFDHRDH